MRPQPECPGDTDKVHLQRAAENGRVLCTSDADFLILTQEHAKHAGIIFGQKQGVSIGDWVRYIHHFHATKTAEEVVGMVFFVERH
ncbi:DUF5615 family PIN-like protein [Aggregatilinea lenta]|uniref:DUF5615 family PIN-like protein n=1 Tax=Aggregatilinea lenta TaxID=913108 RepID=UPI0023AE86BD|nr:DUF5615 family PIN-like protein [Aggregatilinea lenta]